jgi:hypothetical protein
VLTGEIECDNCDGDCSSNVDEADFGYSITCAGDKYPANNGNGNGHIACVCDGKVDCSWQSDDFLGDLTEDGICISDTTCPLSKWFEYEGELILARNRFINDPTHNTLQSDLFDSSKAEVLGRIETTALTAAGDFSSWNWDEGHYLVAVWQYQTPSHVTYTPYGDYYAPVKSNFGDGDVCVWETFVNNLKLRDGSDRDIANQNLEIVFDIRHYYDLDTEDINELLNFRVAMIPKTWEDQYGDLVKITAKELSECLNHVLDGEGDIASGTTVAPWNTPTTHWSWGING